MAVASLVVVAGCGKRGAPLSPLPRVPAAVSADWAALRSDDIVALTLVVPAANVSGDTPGDVAAIEIYAVTAESAPQLDAGRVPPMMTLVATLRVRRPLPPLPGGAAAEVAAVPREPGLDQGERTTFRERLTPELLVATGDGPLVAAAAEPDPSDDLRLSLPVVFTAATQQLKRHYAAVAVGRRGQRGAWSEVRSVPIGPVSGAPSPPTLTYDARAIALAWTPAGDARLAASAPADDRLESRPLGPLVAPTRYNLYGTDAATPGAEAVRLNEQPLAEALYSVPDVTFGRERCFIVHGLDTLDGVDVEGPASPPACVTPVDTFAPAPPTALAAVGGAGIVSLIWEGVDDADLDGYLVFRGVAGSEPTRQLTPGPIRASSFEDRDVTPGIRYVYEVVAVDSATPANRSGPSNRAEETARQ